MNNDLRTKELTHVANKLFDMVHESDLIHNKIKANELYRVIVKKFNYTSCCTELKTVDIEGVEDISDPYWKEYIEGKQ